MPVVATGLAGGRNGRRILEELAEEAILSDFVRIEDESRTSTAVSDPTSGTFTEVMEWGPLVQESELEVLLEKLDYLARGAELVVFAGTLPRGVADDFYAEAIRTLARRGVLTVLDAEGEPLRAGLEAEPFLVSPNRIEAEAVVGQEFSEDGDFLDALERLEDLRRAQRAHHVRARLFRLGARRARPAQAVPCRRADGGRRLRGRLRRRAARRIHRRLARRARRRRTPCAGPWPPVRASTSVGAGRFDPEDVGRLLPGGPRRRAHGRRQRVVAAALLPFIRT